MVAGRDTSEWHSCSHWAQRTIDMKQGEKQQLLDDTDDFGGVYGADLPSKEGDPDSRETTPKRLFPWWQRERKLQRTPPLDKVDEDLEKHDFKKSCPDKLFGVKSYLHHFYEGRTFKDPSIYEEDDDYLLGKPRRRRCTSIWWKVFVWIGANFLIFGIIGVLVGYLVPSRPIFVGSLENIEMIDRGAIAFNFNLDVCKLVGLILFCIGGLTLAVALLFPSFLYHYCDEDHREGSFMEPMSDPEEKAPLSPLEMQVPATSKLTEVQPERKPQESIVTKEGMVSYKD